ncbi:MAG TPA: GTP-binding protein [Stellaceae bacterium]|nr:GTP-binding protein [Stellaceae bacterium]
MIPVNVIGGFLGAGKTSLVNHLLRHTTRRYAVLVNDFGAVNIDAALIETRGEAVIALTNGCICCTIGDDLGAALNRLAERRPAPERVLIEASGVADPWQVAQLALIEPGFTLDAVAVVADAGAFLKQLADPHLGDTVRRQFARADLAIVNKADCADLPLRDAVAEVIREIRPGAAVIEAQYGAIAEELLGFAAAPHQTGPAPHAHEHPFRSWLWCDPRPFDRDRLQALLRALPPSVLRVKGWCRLGPDGGWRLLNFAGGAWNIAPASPPDDPAIVMIGTEAMPPPRALAALFEAALL